MREWLLGVLIGGVATAAAAAPSVDLSAAKTAISQGCKLDGWQVALTPNSEGTTRVELTPTATPAQVQCTYQTLSDWNIPLDRPSPVEVQKRTVKTPTTIY